MQTLINSPNQEFEIITKSMVSSEFDDLFFELEELYKIRNKKIPFSSICGPYIDVVRDIDFSLSSHFQERLKIGQVYENITLTNHQHLRRNPDKYGIDLLGANGTRIEVKSFHGRRARYCYKTGKKCGNAFFLFADIKNKIADGPFRAWMQGGTHFVMYCQEYKHNGRGDENGKTVRYYRLRPLIRRLIEILSCSKVFCPHLYGDSSGSYANFMPARNKACRFYVPFKHIQCAEITEQQFIADTSK